MGATRQALSRKGMKKHLRVASNIWCVAKYGMCPFSKIEGRAHYILL